MPCLLNLKFALAFTLLVLASILAVAPLQAQAPYHRFRPRSPHRAPSRSAGVASRHPRR